MVYPFTQSYLNEEDIKCNSKSLWHDVYSRLIDVLEKAQAISRVNHVLELPMSSSQSMSSRVIKVLELAKMKGSRQYLQLSRSSSQPKSMGLGNISSYRGPRVSPSQRVQALSRDIEVLELAKVNGSRQYIELSSWLLTFTCNWIFWYSIPWRKISGNKIEGLSRCIHHP